MRTALCRSASAARSSMKSVLVISSFALAVSSPSFVQAQWQTDGAPVCTALHDQTKPSLIQDGAGGLFVVWQDARNGTDSNIYLQRLNGNGVAQWTAGGVALCSAAGNQVDARIEVVFVKDQSTANVTAVLLQPNALQPVPCRWN